MSAQIDFGRRALANGGSYHPYFRLEIERDTTNFTPGVGVLATYRDLKWNVSWIHLGSSELHQRHHSSPPES